MDRAIALLRSHKIVGWRRHQDLPGTPDFAFRKGKLAVFVDGCFWHGCPECYSAPKKNRRYWANKLKVNRRQDRKVAGELRARGWSVIRVRECVLKKRPGAVAKRIKRKLAERRKK
jgi:DNA mismatch endonuclease (patch repair protein)